MQPFLRMGREMGSHWQTDGQEKPACKPGRTDSPGTMWSHPQVFRQQGIDGQTLPLLTEEHLLTTMGLKLGPALKIRAQVSPVGEAWGWGWDWGPPTTHRPITSPGPTSPQVAKRLGRVFYMASFPVALPLQPPTPALHLPERGLGSAEQPPSPAAATSPSGAGHTTAGQASPKQENGTLSLLPVPADPAQPLC